MKTIKKFIKYIPSKYTFIFIILGLVYSSVYILQYNLPLFQKNLIDTAINEQNIFNEFFYKLALLYLSYFVIKFILDLFFWDFTLKLRRYMTKILLEKIIFLKKSVILKEGTGYYYDCLTNDLDAALGIYSFSFFNFIFGSIRTFFIFILIWKWSHFISGVFIIASLSSIAISIIASKIGKINWSRIREASSFFSAYIIDILANNSIIKYLLVFPKVQKISQKLYNKFYKASVIDTRYMLSSSTLLEIISRLSQIIVIIYSLSLIISGKLTYGSMIAIIAYFEMLFNPIDSFDEILQVLYSSGISMQRIIIVIEKASTNKIDDNANLVLFDNVESILFKNISLSYNNNFIFRGIDFKIKKNITMGLVGLSGEGKTSLIRLLLKEENPQLGKIFINDIDIQNIPYLLYFSHLNVFSQELEIFNKDLIFNLTMGRIPVENTETTLITYRNNINYIFDSISVILYKNISANHKIKRINKIINDNIDFKEVLEIIGINKNILPGYKYFYRLKELIELNNSKEKITQLMFSINNVSQKKLTYVLSVLELNNLKNRNFGEGGSFISGGEKQKIILGRFLLNENYDYYILDEPFSNMDSITKQKMLLILKNEVRNKTGIVISHNFNTLLEFADEFIILDNGTIKQKGNHNDLINQEGLYKSLLNSYKETNKISKLDIKTNKI